MKKRISILAMALLLLVGALATFAWLTANTDPIVNNFKFAGIEIEIGETFDGENAILYPGAEIEKIPVVTVLANSANSYVYVEIVNGLHPGAEIDINTENWELVEGNIYRYENVVSQSEANQNLPALFTTVRVAKGLTNVEIAALADNTITVSAFAIQADAITLEEANAAAVTHFAP